MSTLQVGTISEKVTDAGVAVDGVTLKDGDVTIADKIIHDGDTNTAIRFPSADTVTIETGGSEVFRVDANGHITKPLQPAFLATMSATQSNLAINSNLTIQFNSEVFDQNADFDTSTYTFTAPVTGRYQLSFILRVDNLDAGADFYSYFLNTSNRSNMRYLFNPDIGTSAGSDVDRFPALMSMLVDMDANDTANIKVFQSNGAVQTDIISDSYFSGHLVC